jgi:hypothetical protein
MARHDPRDYVLGQEPIAKILATGAQTWGVTTSSTRSNFPAPSRPCTCTPVRRKAWSSLKAPALWVGSDTPAHLAGLDTGIDLELFTSVSTDLGDQILGPPDTLPTDS